MNCKHFLKGTIGNPCRGCLLTEVEKLKGEKEGLLKHFRLINGKVTCRNLKKRDKLRKALGGILVQPSPQKRLVIARGALKGDSG